MSAFIVSAGSLLEVGCPSRLDRQTEQMVEFIPTHGGKVKGFVRRGGRRSWSIDVGLASPREVGTLEAVARQMGLYGWYGPDAAAGNLLSPQACTWESVPANGTAAGLVQLPDGTVAQTVAASSTIRVGAAHGTYEMVPVRPGQSVTVGAWGLGGVRFQGFWRDSIGASVDTYLSPADSHVGWKWREHTLTPPAGAAFIELQLIDGSQYALPSVAWGTKGRAELGTGCPKAVIHSPSHSPVALWKGANYTDISYSITEVG